MRKNKHSRSVKQDFLEGKWLRGIELAAIVLLLAAAPLMLVASGRSAGDSQISTVDPNVSAQAYAMPNDAGRR